MILCTTNMAREAFPMRKRRDVANEIEKTYDELKNLMSQRASAENSALEKSLRQKLENLEEEAAALIQPVQKNLATIKQGLEILALVRKRQGKT